MSDFIYELALTEEDIVSTHTLRGRWDEVVKMCKDNYASIHTTRINESRDTVLHAAVDDGEEGIVAELVKLIVDDNEKNHKELQESSLATQNVHGDTPLHVAASRGFTNLCYCIAGENEERAGLLKLRNEQGETPLFLAALCGHKDAFLYLLSIGDYTKEHLTRKNGDTILHCAIRREYFDLAVIIIHYYKELIGFVNGKGDTPLKVLATRPLAFRSSSKLGWWNELLYYCTPAEQVDVENATKFSPKLALDVSDRTHKNYPKNYETCCHIIRTLPKIAASFGFPLIKKQQEETKETDNFESCSNFFTTMRKTAASLIGFFRKKQESSDTENPKTQPKKEDENTVDQIQKLGNLPPNYATFYQCLRSTYKIAVAISGLDLLPVKRMKEKHVWSVQLLDLLMEDPTEAYFGSGMEPYRLDQSNQEILSAYRPRSNINDQGTRDNKDNSQEKEKNKDNVKDKIDMNDSTLLIAARNGILEMVDKILQELPIAIQYTTSKYKRNIVLAAVESRQPLVVEFLRKHKHWENLIRGVDTEENTALHLAAGESRHRAWQIPGSAMQMLWDIKWYEYVKGLVPHHFHLRNNQDRQTPPEIFKEQHEELVKEGSEWLKDTSESCSVVAALIAGVAFATSSAIPGGNNEETGKPIYEGQPAFNVFAITSLVALCFSVTALIMFLAILTSRKMAKDFRKDLPFKLLLGLSSLFISIASMLVSFCASHFFVVRDKFKDILFPIYAATCLPVSFYAIAQFPLYVDLLRAIFTKVPQLSDKGSDL